MGNPNSSAAPTTVRASIPNTFHRENHRPTGSRRGRGVHSQIMSSPLASPLALNDSNSGRWLARKSQLRRCRPGCFAGSEGQGSPPESRPQPSRAAYSPHQHPTRSAPAYRRRSSSHGRLAGRNTIVSTRCFFSARPTWSRTNPNGRSSMSRSPLPSLSFPLPTSPAVNGEIRAERPPFTPCQHTTWCSLALIGGQ